MTRLDPDAIRAQLADSVAGRLADFEAFDEIESTNSYLMISAAPSPGRVRVALTDNQVAGRGRHGRVWHSPTGTGLALSIGYTFVRQPANLAALTLAIGVGAVEALASVGAHGVQLKWPNDLIASDGKIGGILTETQSLPGNAIKVVSGLGLNLELDPDAASQLAADRAGHVVDLATIVDTLPCRNQLAARLIDSLCEIFVGFEAAGFTPYVERWARSDWLRGRQLTVDTPQARVSGRGAGIAEDGALLVRTAWGEVRRITSGTIVLSGRQGESV
jgi:BirA family biotin operon repressor/biotin-[acetyl-CoA-carboxylase] ligase